MTGSEELVLRLPNDIGGSPAEAIQRIEHDLAPWKSAAVLDLHKIINTEENAAALKHWNRNSLTS